MEISDVFSMDAPVVSTLVACPVGRSGKMDCHSGRGEIVNDTWNPKIDGWKTIRLPFGALNGLFSGANLLLVLGSVIEDVLGKEILTLSGSSGSACWING